MHDFLSLLAVCTRGYLGLRVIAEAFIQRLGPEIGQVVPPFQSIYDVLFPETLEIIEWMKPMA